MFRRRKIFAHEKKNYSFKKENQNVSTDLTTESVHPRNSPFASFQTSCAFQQYKKFVNLNFRKQCLTGHVQRSSFTMWSKQ